jgi:hypothetical protein
MTDLLLADMLFSMGALVVVAMIFVLFVPKL